MRAALCSFVLLAACSGDSSLSDGATTNDLAMTNDFAQTDQSTNDQSTIDSAANDLAVNDFAVSDLASSDLAMPSLGQYPPADGGLCNSLPNDGPAVPETNVSGTLPPATGGSTIPPGIYHLTQWEV